MAYAIYHDWSEHSPHMINHGRWAIEDGCAHTTQDQSGQESNMRYSGWCEECGFHEDSAVPMMNFLYPLDIEPTDEAIRKTVEKTCCTVVQNEETEEWFLTLCGGGMDLSQDIGLAYAHCQKWIPVELALRVSAQKGLSQGGANFRRLRKAIIESLEMEQHNIARALDIWRAAGKARGGKHGRA